MTDFLTRTAARAVGEAPVARPRLPALFEEARGAAAAALEVVDEEIAAQEPSADPVPHAPQDTTPVPPSIEVAAPAARRDGTEPGRPAAKRRADSPTIVPPAPRRSRATPVTALLEGEGDARHPEIGSAVVVEPEQESVPPGEPAAVAVPTTAAFPVPAPRVAAPDVAGTGARDEPPAVRVHIGRLEVRANLHEPPRAQPRVEAREPEGPSLADYLRGRREVGP